MKTSPRDMPRTRDEDDLRMLEMRRSGVTPQRIADCFGCVRQDVYRIVTSIMNADLAESGETPSKVRRAYW